MRHFEKTFRSKKAENERLSCRGRPVSGILCRWTHRTTRLLDTNCRSTSTPSTRGCHVPKPFESSVDQQYRNCPSPLFLEVSCPFVLDTSLAALVVSIISPSPLSAIEQLRRSHLLFYPFPPLPPPPSALPSVIHRLRVIKPHRPDVSRSQ